MRRKTPIVSGEVYHICNRAVEGRKIFTSAKDCHYFLETLFLVNSTDTRHLSWRRSVLRSSKKQNFDGDKPLVEIYAICLMPNHFHMLLKQVVENGIPIVMHRSCNSYGKYYNQKYERKGALFMTRYKAVHIESDPQAAHIFSYIHGNPLDIIERRWREGRVDNWTRAKQFLENYQWSSLGVYAGTNANSFFKTIINSDFAKSYFPNKYSHFNDLREWSRRSDESIYLE